MDINRNLAYLAKMITIMDMAYDTVKCLQNNIINDYEMFLTICEIERLTEDLEAISRDDTASSETRLMAKKDIRRALKKRYRKALETEEI